MFFGIGKKKEVKHAQLNSQNQGANSSNTNSVNSGANFMNSNSANTVFNNQPVEHAQPSQDLFGNQVVPPLHSQDSAMTITNPSRVPSDEEVRQKSQLFDQFRQEQPEIDQQDLKRSVIEEEKKIGKIVNDIKPNYSNGNTPSFESSESANISSEDTSYDYDSLDSYSINENESDESENAAEEPVNKDKFVSIMAYKQATKELNVIRKILSESNNAVDDVKAQIQEESKKFDEIKSKLEEIERKIINLDQTLFNED